MIVVTRLNKTPFLLNSDLVKLIDQVHDTVITLVNGEKIIVLESPEEIVERIVAFRREMFRGIDPREVRMVPSFTGREDSD